MASMASHHLLLPLLLFSAVVSTNNAAPAATAPPAPLVRSTCSATSDYDLCVAVLLVDPSSSTADIRGLGAIVLAAAAANASATQAALAKTTTTTASSRVSLIRACADKYGEALVALVKAREAVGQALYGEALLDAGVASEYTAMCQMLFMTRRQSYPAKLAEREMGLDRLCAVASDIITLLISQT